MSSSPTERACDGAGEHEAEGSPGPLVACADGRYLASRRRTPLASPLPLSSTCGACLFLSRCKVWHPGSLGSPHDPSGAGRRGRFKDEHIALMGDQTDFTRPFLFLRNPGGLGLKCFTRCFRAGICCGVRSVSGYYRKRKDITRGLLDVLGVGPLGGWERSGFLLEAPPISYCKGPVSLCPAGEVRVGPCVPGSPATASRLPWLLAWKAGVSLAER